MLAIPIIIGIVLVIILLYLFLCYFIAGTIIYLNRQPVPKNPGIMAWILSL